MIYGIFSFSYYKTALYYAQAKGFTQIVELFPKELINLEQAKRSSKPNQSSHIQENEIKGADTKSQVPSKINEHSDSFIKSLNEEITLLKSKINSLESTISTQDTKIEELETFLNVLKEKSEEMRSIENDEYDEYQILGEGATSTAKEVSISKMYAKKELKQFDHQTLQRFLHEAEILYKLRHPCIVRIFGFSYGDDEHPPSIFLSLEPTSLESSIKNRTLSNEEKNRITTEIILGMRYIHSNNLMHRDLKPANILLSKHKHVRISDFGLAKEEDSETSQSKGVGTLRFMAPELFRDDIEYTNKVDVYSFGIILIFIITHDYPKFALADVVVGKFPKLPPTIVDWAAQLIQQCLSVSPDQRPSFDEIFQILKLNNYDLFNSMDSSTKSSKQLKGKQEIERRILKIEAFEYQHHHTSQKK